METIVQTRHSRKLHQIAQNARDPRQWRFREWAVVLPWPFSFAVLFRIKRSPCSVTSAMEDDLISASGARQSGTSDDVIRRYRNPIYRAWRAIVWAALPSAEPPATFGEMVSGGPRMWVEEP